ncbi:MAG TPA: TrmH family RNA methyltransferase [Ramlibacter sp.]
MKNKMIFGFHAVTSRLRHEAQSVEDIFVDAGRQDRRMQDLIAHAKQAGVRVMPVDAERLDKIVGTRRHQGVIAFASQLSLARTMRDLKERGIWLIGTSDDADKGLYEGDFTGPTALVMGSEGEGMRRLTRETCDVLVSIPMFGSVESLNVSVASGVCLYEARRQRMVREPQQ